MSGYYYQEEQRFNQRWMWLIMVASLLVVVGVMGNALAEQLYYHRQAEKTSLSDASLVLVSILVFTATGAGVWLMYSARLETRIDRRAFEYKFFPFIPNWKSILREQINGYRVRSYSFRGYGIRFGILGTRTLNVQGNKGIEIEYIGKKILVGTQKPEEMQAAFDKMMHRREE